MGGDFATHIFYRYIAVMAFSDLGILPQSSSGSSSSTHFCDGVITAVDGTLKMAFLGGNCNGGVLCGAFACVLFYTVAYSYWDVVASPQTKHGIRVTDNDILLIYEIISRIDKDHYYNHYRR